MSAASKACQLQVKHVSRRHLDIGCPPSPPSVSTSISLSVAPADGPGDYATVKQQMFEDKPVVRNKYCEVRSDFPSHQRM